ncbi:Phosphoenolpyruvate synthase/pyruvate phosphate dikinase [Frankia sp. AiPs1]|uniref:PEP/pyruvate-binding domain-containing protein n=1 Tax=Frankia sp. AiPa1 TaxID=573492 RepID=UPI00202ADC93|nr:PEP/pyruvate-binding domain-containing protein [Frankia sp. AiPa1]MCL9760896.1 PEP-utilizing enzyme [Frankia sp. AiPa1]
MPDENAASLVPIPPPADGAEIPSPTRTTETSAAADAVGGPEPIGPGPGASALGFATSAVPPARSGSVVAEPDPRAKAEARPDNAGATGTTGVADAAETAGGAADRAGTGAQAGGGERLVVRLDDAAARDVSLVGAKAANLAVAAGAGLPVIPGFVVTTVATDPDRPGGIPATRGGGTLYERWRELTHDGELPLAVRSSSVAEDSASSSYAGQFLSVLHVTGWEAFTEAVGKVVASAAEVAGPAAEVAGSAAGPMPIAVLVQPMAQARVGGVMFGLDPLTGNAKRVLVSMTDGLPELIVSGQVTGTTMLLARHGRLTSVEGTVPAAVHAHQRRQLARLARRTAKVFGAPQDMEWLIEPDGTLRLLQSRPITAAVPVAHGRVFGPGPVAETFPEPLSHLELELWLPPLEDGIREALRISGAAGGRALRRRFVIDVQGRVAVDLEALGVIKSKHWYSVLDPRPGARRLRAAWRLGRLRAAFPAIVADLAEEIDADLHAVPDLAALTDSQLNLLLYNAGVTLRGTHAHEVLAGFFLDARASATTGAAVALAAVSHARDDGLSDAEIVARHPEALALVAPSIGAPAPLPPTPAYVRAPSGRGDDPVAVAREAMRLRARWLHEITARAALELGRRLVRHGQLHHPADVRHLSLDQLQEMTVSHAIAAAALPGTASGARPAGGSASLPARFRLSADGQVVADRRGSGTTQGVSPGRARGLVTHDAAGAAGRVLVVNSLDPGLAAALPDLAALVSVSVTGSPLSHLAILARENGIPAVIGVADATTTFADGDEVLVDGSTGEVTRIDTNTDADMDYGENRGGGDGGGKAGDRGGDRG